MADAVVEGGITPLATPFSNRPSGGAEIDASSLLPLALSQPNQALAIAIKLLEERPDREVASYAHQAAGIVYRDRGQMPEALQEMRGAVRCARATGSNSRLGDVLASYGATLAMAGRSNEGLRQLDRAVSLVHGVVLARVRLRRAHVLGILGRHREALVDLRWAIRVTRRAGDVLWEARSLNNRSLVHVALGEVHRAETDVVRAEALFAALGQQLESVEAIHNRGLVQLVRGNLPAALDLLDEAAAGYRRLDVSIPELVIDRAHTLLSAGLAIEAVASIEPALREPDLQPTMHAELLQVSAAAAFAAGDLERARSRADEAAGLFAQQRRRSWEAHARLVSAQADYAAGRADHRLLSGLLRLSSELSDNRAEEAPLAFLLAGRIALDRGRVQKAQSLLEAAGRYRFTGPPISRAAAWLAVAVAADVRDQSRQVLTACAHGLDALDEHRLYFGGELRAHATEHGRELALLALRTCLRRGSSRNLLRWSERWRATALTAPAVHPPDDQALEHELAAYRDATRRLTDAQRQGAATALTQRERDEWEEVIRRRRRHERGAEPLGPLFTPIDLSTLSDHLDATRLITLVEIDDALYAITMQNGRVRRTYVGSVSGAHRELQFAQFALRRAAIGRPIDPAQVGARLERELLGAVAGRADEPVVLVPSRSLHSVPWGLLPRLAEIPLTIAPSAAFWLGSSRRPKPERLTVTAVVAPGLSSEDREAVAMARIYDEPTILVGDAATVPHTLAALDGATIGHIAAHGTFRSDSPLFSCLHLADGPLTVHDLERLPRPPHIMLLSACDTAVTASVGSDELLGLVTGLLGLGTASVLASVVPVNDVATVEVMRSVHTALHRGATLPQAWLAARQAARDDENIFATAASFTAWGA